MQLLTHSKVVARALLIVGVLALTVGLYIYVARAEGPGDTYARGFNYSHKGLNLKVDSTASYNGTPVASGTWGLKNLKPGKDTFFNFTDIKPGDSGENTISLHTNKDAWVCLEFLNLEEDENGQNEPESLEDASDEGELAENIEFFAWHDDGDNIFEVGEKKIFGSIAADLALDNQVYTIADSVNGPALPQNQTKYVGVLWCAGDLSVNLATAEVACSGAGVGNEVQTDSMSVDVQLVAASAKDETYFKCSDIEVPPPGEECKLGEVNIKIENSATVTNNVSSSANGSAGSFLIGLINRLRIDR